MRIDGHAGYSSREVAEMLGLSVAQVRAYVHAGFLHPARGSRRELRFSFQDLVLLRTAKGLLAAEVPAVRVRRALKKLRAQLPTGRPLSAVHITAESNRIVVRDGAKAWQPESGQVLLQFGVAGLAAEVAPLVRRAARVALRDREARTADQWYELGCELEVGAPAEASDAYRRALELDAELVEAHVNLGRLLHEAGERTQAEACYRRALTTRPDDATAAFNLGVVLEDLGRLAEAVTAYEHSLEVDPGSADAHYNLATLHERLGHKAAAIRHLKAYQRLVQA